MPQCRGAVGRHRTSQFTPCGGSAGFWLKILHAPAVLCCAVHRALYMCVSLLQDSDSAGQKLGGALLNGIIFMAVIGGMTVLLFLLFKWGVSG